MNSLDPAFIKQLLAKPEPTKTTKRKPKTLERTVEVWFDLNRQLGSIIDGECPVEDCVTLREKGTRHAVTVNVPINPITTMRMCRRCYVNGVGLPE